MIDENESSSDDQPETQDSGLVIPEISTYPGPIDHMSTMPEMVYRETVPDQVVETPKPEPPKVEAKIDSLLASGKIQPNPFPAPAGVDLSHIGIPLRIHAVDITKVFPDPANANKHPEESIRALMNMLQAFGQYSPCVATAKDKIIRIGNGRYEAARRLGWKYIAVFFADLSPVEATALAIGDNRSAQFSEFDQEILTQQLGSLNDEGFNLDSIGFTVDDIFFEGRTTGAGGDEFDATPADSGPTRTNVGEVYLIGGRHRFLVGDCTKAESIKVLFNGQKPFLMVTDPPYGVNYDPTWRHKAGVNKSTRTGAVKNDDNADLLKAWDLFPGPVCYVWHGGLHSATVQQSIERAGFKVRAQIIWVKPRLVLSRGHYHWQHEPAFKGERSGLPGEQPDGPVVAELMAVDPTEGECEETWYAVRDKETSGWTGGRKQTTVWNIGFQGEEKTFHGTQKPIECMAKPIRNHGKPGDIVYDPFLCSGTTLIAAHRTGRTCFGCELNPLYADVILKRAEAEGLHCVLETTLPVAASPAGSPETDK